MYDHGFLPWLLKKQAHMSFTPVVVFSLGVGFFLHFVTSGVVIWWKPFVVLIFFASAIFYLCWGLQEVLHAYSLQKEAAPSGSWDSDMQRENTLVAWHRNANMMSSLLWFSLAGGLFMACFMIEILPPTPLALLMATFCLGALLSLMRYITLAMPPLPRNF